MRKSYSAITSTHTFHHLLLRELRLFKLAALRGDVFLVLVVRHHNGVVKEDDLRYVLIGGLHHSRDTMRAAVSVLGHNARVTQPCTACKRMRLTLAQK